MSKLIANSIKIGNSHWRPPMDERTDLNPIFQNLLTIIDAGDPCHAEFSDYFKSAKLYYKDGDPAKLKPDSKSWFQTMIAASKANRILFLGRTSMLRGLYDKALSAGFVAENIGHVFFDDINPEENSSFAFRHMSLNPNISAVSQILFPTEDNRLYIQKPASDALYASFEGSTETQSKLIQTVNGLKVRNVYIDSSSVLSRDIVPYGVITYQYSSRANLLKEVQIPPCRYVFEGKKSVFSKVVQIAVSSQRLIYCPAHLLPQDMHNHPAAVGFSKPSTCEKSILENYIDRAENVSQEQLSDFKALWNDTAEKQWKSFWA